ncbi:MAG: flagellar basal body rod protein FlgC [Gemmatimonadales bacterium]|nr:MAG: flagellar basal body rod protein FlgC [Gemmatimonadales bacterium]
MSIGGLPQGGVRGLLKGLSAPASGLRAQKARIDTIALNLANAGTTAPPGEMPYRRQVVELAAQPGPPGGGGVARPAIPALPAIPPGAPGGPTSAPGRPGDDGVRVVGVAEDPGEGPLVYDPGHPHADEQGYVRYPNVDTTRELVELLEARRLFEANASVFEAMKSVLRRSLEI